MAVTQTNFDVSSAALVATGAANLKTIGRRGLKAVEQMAADGLSNTSIAKALRIDRGTLREILKRQPDVEEALARGRAGLEDELTDILLTKARQGETVAAIYLTKARCGWREGDVPAGSQITNNTQVNILIPPAMSDDEFARLTGQ